MRNLQPAYKLKRNALAIIKNTFYAFCKGFERKNMLRLPTKNIRPKSITATF